jgi:hypothetical protein
MKNFIRHASSSLDGRATKRLESCRISVPVEWNSKQALTQHRHGTVLIMARGFEGHSKFAVINCQ